jgi:thiamine biosynthesis lipoprotein
MASPLRLGLHGLAPAAAGAAWDAVRDEFEACEEAMSRFRETSELTALNRAAVSGAARRVGPRLRRALVAADRAARQTGGRFDARRLRDLDRLGYRGAPVPEAGLGPRPDTAWHGRLLEVRPDGTVRLPVPVDLGGIGKGLALRWAADRLRRAMPAGGGALLEAGGDVVAVGSAPGGAAWLVGVEDPGGGSMPIAVVALRDAAIATSSIAVHRWRSPTGDAVHHLLDPDTGAPGGAGLVAVSVQGPDPAWAEVRTKQLFLAGRGAIGPLARSLGLAAWWVDDAAVAAMTPAARLVTTWTPSVGDRPGERGAAPGGSGAAPGAGIP